MHHQSSSQSYSFQQTESSKIETLAGKKRSEYSKQRGAYPTHSEKSSNRHPSQQSADSHYDEGEDEAGADHVTYSRESNNQEIARYAHGVMHSGEKGELFSAELKSGFAESVDNGSQFDAIKGESEEDDDRATRQQIFKVAESNEFDPKVSIAKNVG